MTTYRPSRFKRIADAVLLIYAALTAIAGGVYLYEKHFTTFDDIIYVAPSIFTKNVYHDLDNVAFYSLMGTSNSGSQLNIVDPLFCTGTNGQWTRQTPKSEAPPVWFTMQRDESRNREIESLLKIGSNPMDKSVIDAVRAIGERNAKNGTGYAISQDMSYFNEDRPTTCRINVYLTTKTQFFDILKTEQYKSSIFTVE